MATERRLIDANVWRNETCVWCNEHYPDDPCEPSDCPAMQYIDNFPTVDAVSRGVHDQVRWERDTAIGQLEEHGIPFGGIAPDVVKVVRCKDCKHWGGVVYGGRCKHWSTTMQGTTFYTSNDDFCSYGERRTDNG